MANLITNQQPYFPPLKKSAPDYISAIKKYFEDEDYENAFNCIKDCKNLGLTFKETGTYNGFMNSFIKAGETAYSKVVYDLLIKSGHNPDIYTLNILLNECVQERDSSTASELLDKFSKAYHIEPNEVTYQTLMKVCDSSGDRNRALQVVEMMSNKGIELKEPIFQILSRLEKLEQRKEKEKKGIKTPGDFLVVQLSEESWKAVAEIQHFVTAKLREEGINLVQEGGTWAPTPFHLNHITLFKDFTDTLSPSEQNAVMKKVAQKVENLKEFSVDVEVRETKLRRSTGVWVVLQFAGPKLVQLQNLVKEAVKEVRAQARQDKSKSSLAEISDEFLSETDVTAKPHAHITLGILDIGPNLAHKSLVQLGKGSAVKKFDAVFEYEKQNRLKGLSFRVPVRTITLLRTDDLSARASNKVYNVLSQIPLKKEGAAVLNPPKTVPSTKSAVSEGEKFNYYTKLISEKFPTTDGIFTEVKGGKKRIVLRLDSIDAVEDLIRKCNLQVDDLVGALNISLTEDQLCQIFGDSTGREIYKYFSETNNGFHDLFDSLAALKISQQPKTQNKEESEKERYAEYARVIKKQVPDSERFYVFTDKNTSKSYVCLVFDRKHKEIVDNFVAFNKTPVRENADKQYIVSFDKENCKEIFGAMGKEIYETLVAAANKK